MSLISIVVPVYNEQSCLNALFDRFIKLQNSLNETFEYIFIDDGSTDSSGEIIRHLSDNYDNVKHIFFSRNFGHESAITAGIDHACGDAVIVIDADLQDPPEIIPELIEKWRQGNHIVYAQRRHREGETFFKRFFSWFFYRTIRFLSNTNIPVDTGDFRLMDRCVAEHFRRCREQNRFARGLLAWTGFKQTAVLYDRDRRYAGKTKYNFFKLFILALDAILGFSNLPLRLAIFVGMTICFFSTAMFFYIIVQKIVCGIPIQGYALSVSGMFFLGGVQLAMLGLIGEYIARIYCETQHRPLYIISEKSKSLPRSYEGHFTASHNHRIDNQTPIPTKDTDEKSPDNK